MKKCACGCGRDTGYAKNDYPRLGIKKGEPLLYVPSHTSRSLKARDKRESTQDINQTGLCMCGCGNPAPLATKTRYGRGQVAGRPVRFINGHNKVPLTPEVKRLLREGHRRYVPTDEIRRKISESKRGEKNPAWKGGERIQRKRKLVYVGKKHPMANVHGYSFAHRLVMAGAIGRPFRSSEHVHHLDCDSLNNDPSNLIIVSASEHSRIHRLMDWHGISPLEAVCQVLNHERAPA